MCEVNIDDCLNHGCKHESKCIDKINSYLCSCAPNFTGEFCENKILACDSRPCMNNGTCIDSNISDYECVCPNAFKGRNCESKIDPCNGSLCQVHNVNNASLSEIISNVYISEWGFL